MTQMNIATNLDSFKNKLIIAQNAGAGSRTALNKALQAAHDCVYAYDGADDATRVEFDDHLAVLTKGHPGNKATTYIHRILTGTFGADLEASAKSHRAKVLNLALADKVKPREFIDWLTGKGGIAKLTNPKGAARKTNVNKEAASKGRNKLKDSNTVLYVTDDIIKFSQSEVIPEERIEVAIGTRHRDGSFTIRALISDTQAVDTALSVYGK